MKRTTGGGSGVSVCRLIAYGGGSNVPGREEECRLSRKWRASGQDGANGLSLRGRFFSRLGAHPAGGKMAPKAFVFGRAVKLGIEMGYCWS